MTRERKSRTQREQLSDAVTAEEELLARAPSLAKDGPRVHRDSDDGATAEIMLTASEILEAQGLGPRLRSLEGDTDKRQTELRSLGTDGR